MLSKKVQLDDLSHQQQHLASSYGSRYIAAPVPKYDMPEEQMPANIAYQIIHDEMNLDGNPAMNLATFVTTWMEPEADKLFIEAMGKNYIDADEYPQSTEIQNRCVNMLARLFNAPPGHDSVGTATVGSSEAIHLAGLALKWNWRKRRAAAGQADRQAQHRDGRQRPGLLGEVRPLLRRRAALRPQHHGSLRDRRPRGDGDGRREHHRRRRHPGQHLQRPVRADIKGLNDALAELNEKTGWDVPIHVDGASGAFVAPFLEPELEWDFRLPLVRSINVSGHKYGLVYPGVGWVIWRDEAHLPEELIFHVNYLGGDQPSFTLNFSRGASQIIAQYYNFLRLGRAVPRDHAQPAGDLALPGHRHRRHRPLRPAQRRHRACRWCASRSRRTAPTRSSMCRTTCAGEDGSSPPTAWRRTPRRSLSYAS